MSSPNRFGWMRSLRLPVSAWSGWRPGVLTAAISGCLLAVLPLGAGVAAASGPPSLSPNFDTFGATAGVPFTYPVSFTVSAASESNPVTVTSTQSAFSTGLTVLSVPAPGPNWDCSGSNLAAQTIICVYTPTAPLAPGTSETFDVDAVAPAGTAATAIRLSSPDAGSSTTDPNVIITVAGPPGVYNVIASPALTALGSGTTLTATASAADGNSVISAEYNINGGAWTPMPASDGNFDSSTESVSVVIPPPTAPTADTLCVRATEEFGFTSDGTACTSFVVYDPSSGFVTGGGWIVSPVGACTSLTLCAGVSGKGTFGFVSKYQKGATVPTGNTQYVFHDGNLNFASSSYQWLVVNQGGTNAQFKGAGTINGAGSYQFMIWATSGSPNAFRIQITDSVNGSTVYDTGTQALGGGSIMIHKS